MSTKYTIWEMKYLPGILFITMYLLIFKLSLRFFISIFLNFINHDVSLEVNPWPKLSTSINLLLKNYSAEVSTNCKIYPTMALIELK